MADAETTATLTEAQQTFLHERPHAIVATIMPDGGPQLTPNWYLWDTSSSGSARLGGRSRSRTQSAIHASRCASTVQADGPITSRCFARPRWSKATSASGRSTSSASTNRSRPMPRSTGKG